MLEADAAHLVGERDQEIVVVVVVRAVELVGLLHQLAVRLDLLGCRSPGTSGRSATMFRRTGALRAGVEVDALEVAAGEHRRIDQGLEVDRLEARHAASVDAALQRGAETASRPAASRWRRSGCGACSSRPDRARPCSTAGSASPASSRRGPARRPVGERNSNSTSQLRSRPAARRRGRRRRRPGRASTGAPCRWR